MDKVKVLKPILLKNLKYCICLSSLSVDILHTNSLYLNFLKFLGTLAILHYF